MRRYRYKAKNKNGEVVAVTFDGESRFYGTTEFGTYKIAAMNIKEIIFE